MLYSWSVVLFFNALRRLYLELRANHDLAPLSGGGMRNDGSGVGDTYLRTAKVVFLVPLHKVL